MSDTSSSSDSSIIQLFEDYYNGEMEVNSESSSYTSASEPESSNHASPNITNSSENFDYQSECSSSSSMYQSINQWNYEINDKTTSWRYLSGLYKREIGDYKNSVLWSNKIRQSVVTVQKLKLSKQLDAHKSSVNAINFNDFGDMLVSGSVDESICLWDWSKGNCLTQYPSRGSILQTKFLCSGGNMHIVSCDNYGDVNLFALNNTDIVHTSILAHHKDICNNFSLHKESPYEILSCGNDGIVKSIDIREQNIRNVVVKNILHLKSLIGNSLPLSGIDINPMNKCEFLIYGQDECIRIYDKRNMSRGPIRVLKYPTKSNPEDDEYFKLSSVTRYQKEPKYEITSAVYNYCGTEILVSYVDNDIYLLDVNGTYLHQYCGHSNKSNARGVIFYGPRDEYVVSGSSCGHMFIWNKNTEVLVQGKHADNGSVNTIAAHPRLPTLASVGMNHTIKIWEPLNRWHPLNRKKMRTLVVRNKALTQEFRSSMAIEEIPNVYLESLLRDDNSD